MHLIEYNVSYVCVKCFFSGSILKNRVLYQIFSIEKLLLWLFDALCGSFENVTKFCAYSWIFIFLFHFFFSALIISPRDCLHGLSKQHVNIFLFFATNFFRSLLLFTHFPSKSVGRSVYVRFFFTFFSKPCCVL